MTTVTKTVTTPPTAPARSDAPATFISRADTFIAWFATLVSDLTTWAGQVNTVAGEVNSNASTASAAADTATTQAGIATTKAGDASTYATNAQNSANAAAASEAYAAGLVATSTTSLAIGAGSKTFTTQSGKQFAAGQFILAVSAANSANYMHGQVTSYSSTNLVVNVLDIGGSGTKTDWNISVSGSQGATGAGVSGVGTLTLAGNLTTSGAYAVGFTMPGAYTYTYPGATCTLAQLGANTFTAAQTIPQVIIPTPASDGLATGPTTSIFNCGYTSSAVGDLVYLDSSATWQKADADASATTYSGLLGIALEVKATGNALLVALPGSIVWAAAAFPTFTVGGVIYMSTTAGAVTQTAPTATDSATRVIGWAIHADKMFFNPSPDYITHT